MIKELSKKFPKDKPAFVMMKGGVQGSIVISDPFLFKGKICVNMIGFGRKPVWASRLREM